MQVNVSALGSDATGTIDLNDAVFGVTPRSDVLHQVVTWQLAKRRQGTHKAKTRGEVSGTTQKVYRQKGTGRARHGNRKANIFKGGGLAFPPLPRDHGTSLPKKVRQLGLKMALSAKQAEGKLVVLEAARLDEGKTKILAGQLKSLGLESILLIDAADLDTNFTRAAQNLPHVSVLPDLGANVYDILRRDTLVLTRAAVEALEARLA